MKKDLLNKIIKEELISQLNEAVKLDKENMQYYALSYLKTTNTLSRISRTAYQTWMKGLKSSYTRQEAADSILNLIKDAGLLPRISKSKHQNWMKKFLGEGKLKEYGGSEFSKITALKNFLTIDLDKFERGLKSSKHKAIYKKARKEFMKVVSDVAWQHENLYEDKLTEASKAQISKAFSDISKLSVAMLLNIEKFKAAKAKGDEKAIAKHRKLALDMQAKKKKMEADLENMVTGIDKDIELTISEATNLWKHFDAKMKLQDTIMDLEYDMKMINKDLSQLHKDMEQEAEPEGGPKATRYGREIEKKEKEYKKKKAEFKKLMAKLDRMEQY